MVRQHSARGSAADDADVCFEHGRSNGVGGGDLQRMRAPRWDGEGLVAWPLGKWRVANCAEGAPVAVVAEIRNLLGNPDHDLHEPPPPVRDEAEQHVLAEVLLDMVEARFLIELREWRLEIEKRVQVHPEESEPVHPAAVRPDVPDVALHVGRHVRGRHRLVWAPHQHLGEGRERAVLHRTEELQLEPRGPRRLIKEEQHRGDGAIQGNRAPEHRADAQGMPC